MTLSHINDMLDKIEDVRTLFVLGQRSLPFLEEVFHFLKEISPLLDEINTSIQETTHKMPRAATQLQSVTQATELATTEILDLVDAVCARVGDVRTSVEQGSRLDKALADADERILQLLRSTLQERESALLADVEHLFQHKTALRQKRASLYQPVFEGLEQIRTRVNDIMLSLQVQDITSQQIAAAGYLIESIRERMAVLMSRLGAYEEDSAGSQASIDIPVAFDPGARYDRSEDRQSVADEVFDAGMTPSHLNIEPAQRSQADIDALFISRTEPDAVPTSSGSFFDPRQPGGDGHGNTQATPPIGHPRRRDASRDEGKESQDEIDRLFEDGF